jgi:hypothetical protein
MLFLFLWLYSIVWSQVLWYLLLCSFCSTLPWLFTVFCASIWNLELIFQSLCIKSLRYWWGLHWTYRLIFGSATTFMLILPNTNMEIFPFSDILFNFILQWFIVFIVEVFHILCQIFS